MAKKSTVGLTKKLIDMTPCPEEGQAFLRDKNTPGFAVRLTPKQKTFILEKRIKGQMRRITIGQYGPLTVDQAREKAIDYIYQIIKGDDPAQGKRDARNEPTFGDLIDRFVEMHVSRKGVGTGRLYNGIIKNHLSQWRTRKLSSLDRDDIERLHAELGQKSPYMANRMIAVLRKMFNLAIKWKMFTGENPGTRIELFREEKRERFLSPDEVPLLFESLKQEPDPFLKGAIMMMLFVGQRKKETLDMKWTDVDLTQNIWRIQETKSGRPHTVPLFPAVIALLNNIPRLKDNIYVFPGPTGKPFHNLNKAWQRIKARAIDTQKDKGVPEDKIISIDDLRMHDLRRTVGSWLASTGEGLPLIGRVLNHSQPSTTAVYARLQLDPVRAALNNYAERLQAIGNRKPIPEGN